MGKKIINAVGELPSVYKAGIILILLAGALLSHPPLFSPPAFGKAILFRIVFGVLLLFFLYGAFFSKNAIIFRRIIGKIRAEKGLFFFAPLILLFALVFSLIFSVDSNFSIFGSPSRGGGLLNFFLLFVFGYFLYFLLDKKNWKLVWNTLFFTGVVAVFFALLQWQGWFEQWVVQAARRPFATFGNPTILGVYLALLFFPLLGFLLKETEKRWKTIYSVALLFIFFGVLLTFTRAAVLGLLAGALFFALFFPRKEKVFKFLKAGLLGCVLLAGFLVYFVNTAPLPQFVENTPFLYQLTRRMDVQRALEDPRIGGFIISWEAIKEKPITGYGPENFAYAFDRHYHPDAPYIQKEGWWDKAHNLPLEIGVWGGFPAMGALFLVFISLFLALMKKSKEYAEKEKEEREREDIGSHAMKATLITFFVANFFTVDDFAIYLVFAVAMGYIFHLCIKEKEADMKEELGKRERFSKYGYVFLIISIPFYLYFANLNFSMLSANRDITVAEKYSEIGECQAAVSLAEKATEIETPINSHIFFRKGLILENCVEEEENRKEIFEMFKKVTEERPTFTRGWSNLAGAALNLIPYTKDREETLETAIEALLRAEEISPNRYTTKGRLALLYLRKDNLQKSLESAEECLSLGEEGECFFAKGVSLSILGKENAKEALEEARKREVDIALELQLIINHHIYTENYKALIPLYLIMIEEQPEEAQHYSSIAAAYKETGDYQRAREYALKALDFQPEAAPVVEAFIRSLPE